MDAILLLHHIFFHAHLRVVHLLFYTFYFLLVLTSNYWDKYLDLGDKVLPISQKSSTFASDLKNESNSHSRATLASLARV